LKITLAEVKPPIWRRLRVPGEANLGWLHAVIQVAMGWTNSHLHQFTSGGTVYSDPGFDLDEFEDDPKVFDERQATLQKIAPKLKSVLLYEYDFGDSWNHFITVEKTLPADPAVAPGAECLDGARACPPEDCGGVCGYADL
jgi:Plasmid pRiA4b ORF-3-like protein